VFVPNADWRTIMFKKLLSVLTIAGVVLAGGAAHAQTVAVLKAGDAAPDFAIPEGVAKDQIGEAKKLSALKGKKVVLAFYPKAFTPGCTNQLCGYRDDFSSFKSSDTVVIAISADEQSESNRFKEEHTLPFAVVGDPKHEIIKKYGVELTKRGEFEYAKRTTFLIDKEGKIAYVDWNYDWAKGKEPLMAEIKKLDETK
jgi:peroxiredoxin